MWVVRVFQRRGKEFGVRKDHKLLTKREALKIVNGGRNMYVGRKGKMYIVHRRSS